ncbi:MAG: CIA30 family protein [Acidobacteria bacterium]|nr:CIA30 family protein [Acidobacteriota bacterium]
MDRNLLGRLAVVGLALGLIAGACGGSAATSSVDPSVETTAAPSPSTTASSASTIASSAVIVAFPDPASVDAWRNVDDSVMGGVSDSTSSWVDVDGGAMEFTGDLSTENNGGFASTLSPVDRTFGARAVGAGALRVSAQGDGRTYLLQLRAGANGSDRWISRFTPAADGATGSSAIDLPIASFEAVNGFLRPVTPTGPLDPATITQIGVYVLDGQVGRFRLVLVSITPVR